MTSTAIDDLIARLEKLTGPDTDLAVDINNHFEIASYITDDGDPTASVDAAYALVERVIHPHHPLHASSGSRYHRAEITWPSHERQGYGPTPAIALCIAILRAAKESPE